MQNDCKHFLEIDDNIKPLELCIVFCVLEVNHWRSYFVETSVVQFEVVCVTHQLCSPDKLNWAGVTWIAVGSVNQRSVTY